MGAPRKGPAPSQPSSSEVCCGGELAAAAAAVGMRTAGSVCCGEDSSVSPASAWEPDGAAADTMAALTCARSAPNRAAHQARLSGLHSNCASSRRMRNRSAGRGGALFEQHANDVAFGTRTPPSRPIRLALTSCTVAPRLVIAAGGSPAPWALRRSPAALLLVPALYQQLFLLTGGSQSTPGGPLGPPARRWDRCRSRQAFRTSTAS